MTRRQRAGGSICLSMNVHSTAFLPSGVHPTARALFDALDAQQKHNKKNDSLLTLHKSSTRIRKQTTTLGWRNRYAQATDYPVSLHLHNSHDGTFHSDDYETVEFTVRQVQRGEVDGTFGTGATVWPASMVLIKYLEHSANRQAGVLLKNKTVVDLGAGTGAASLAAAWLGARRVVCTDGCEAVVDLSEDNVSRVCDQNHKTAHSTNQRMTDACAAIHVQKYSWGDGSLAPQRFDIVLVSDCVLPKLYPIEPLVRAVDELLHVHGTPDAMALLSYEHRYYPDYDPKEKFIALAAGYNLKIRVIPLDEQDPIYSVEDIELWMVTRE